MQLNHKDKIVTKPWGISGIGEIWHCLSKDFCAKTIRIAKNFKTSLQFHNQKEEINFIRKGEGLLFLEDENGQMQEYHLKEGDSFFVPTPRKHRVVALTDLEMFEVSNEFVHDVVRIDDSYGRTGINTKIEDEHKTPAVLLLAAGKGERVKSITRGLHKALLKIECKAAISHLIEKIDPFYDIVVAIGYNGHLLQNYLAAAHPDRKFTFVQISDYESPESGPGKSALACKPHLSRPFYLMTIDCFFDGSLPALDSNWIGTSPTDLPEIYSTAKVEDGNVVDFKNKSPEGYDQAFVGICGIKDHEAFWEALGDSKEVVAAFEQRNFPLKARSVEWCDLGNIDGYHKLTSNKGYYNLAKKLEEDTYIVNGRVVKLNSNAAINKERVDRASFLTGLVPQVSGHDYCLSYDLVPGKTLYELDDLTFYKRFIDWHLSVLSLDTNFAYTPTQEETAARKFYLDKTKERLETFYQDHPEFRKFDPLQNVDWNQILKPELTKTWHGDLQPDNIIYDGQKFTWIDWRANFAGYYDGDAYYDLAKLYGGLSFNYLAAKDLSVFEFSQVGDEFFYKVPQTPNMAGALRYFEQQLQDHRFSLEKIRQITGIIWLNMSPLHLYPMNLVCHLEGIKMLDD